MKIKKDINKLLEYAKKSKELGSINSNEKAAELRALLIEYYPELKEILTKVK